MAKFKVGQKVTLVERPTGKAADHKGVEVPDSFGIKYPVFGEVYTIREYAFEGYLRLNEVRNMRMQFHDGFDEACFCENLFAPVQERIEYVTRKVEVSIPETILQKELIEN